MYLASSPSGWQTRDTFLFWVLCFINEFSLYRRTLDENVRNEKALLIMDGHASRECPMAFIFLKARNIDVLILPSHCTHVLQIFDVSIASPLKNYFGAALKKYLHDMNDEGPAAPKIRRAAIEAFLHAWSAACTYKNCVNGARKTGIYPLSLDAMCESHFVRDLPDEEVPRQRPGRLNINNAVITKPEMISEINSSISKFEKFRHLCLRHYDGCYQKVAQQAVSQEHNGCRLLSKLPPFVTNNDQIIYFK